jgi:hypothetical protein
MIGKIIFTLLLFVIITFCFEVLKDSTEEKLGIRILAFLGVVLLFFIGIAAILLWELGV